MTPSRPHVTTMPYNPPAPRGATITHVTTCLDQRRGRVRTCSLRCMLTPAARAASSSYNRLNARHVIHSGMRFAKWAGGSRSQTHRRAATVGFTQDNGYVRGVAADTQRGILLRPCRASCPCSRLSSRTQLSLQLSPWYQYRYLCLEQMPAAGSCSREHCLRVYTI